MWNTGNIFVLYFLFFLWLIPHPVIFDKILDLWNLWCMYVYMYVYVQEWFKFNILLWQNHKTGGTYD